MTPALEVRDLDVCFPGPGGGVRAVDRLSFAVDPGETLGIVGESGSGKTAAVLAVAGLHTRRVKVAGSVRLGGEELVGQPEAAMRRIRGRRMAVVFQDASGGLNPTMTAGRQVSEAVSAHRRLNRADAETAAVELLDLVGVADPSRRAGQFPHELSGGMRQRVMIAMAIANDPEVVLADEPTTALDVTVAAQVLDVFRRLQERSRTAIVLVTHDLAVVAGTADRVLVMYGGRAVEEAPVLDLFDRPGHPYTAGLLACLPRVGVPRRARLFQLDGAPPSPTQPPPGCGFAPRCSAAQPGRCDAARPELRPLGAGRFSACLRSDDLGHQAAST